jgi:sugar phosphate isomerase/epimerase
VPLEYNPPAEENMAHKLSRRDFLGTSTAALCAASSPASAEYTSPAPGPYKGPLCFFSKPLPELDWRALAKAAKGVGFDGIDLTVRPGGHVKPERAAEDLPKAVEMIRDEGLQVPMITTGLTSADDPTARPILSTAAKLSIPFFKVGYYQYRLVNVRRELEEAGAQFRGLIQMSRQFGVQAGYHNHEEYIGAAVWDMARIIDTLDPKWVGYYFDPRHATAEGGVGCWKISTNLVKARLKMVAIKDFRWQKTEKGWEDNNCPLGEGMVNWKYFMKELAGSGFHGPISLHHEYEVSGDTQAARRENILANLRHDLAYLKARLNEAYGA